jgi:hypothetical protein
MPHHTRRDQFRSRVDHAAQHAFGRDALADDAGRVDAVHPRAGQRATVLVEVPEGDAVLHGDDHRIGPEQLGHVCGHRFHLVRLQRQDHQVLRPGVGAVVGGAHVAGDVFAAVLHDQFHAAGADGLEVLAAHDEGDVFAGQCQLHADIAADGTGTDDGHFHGRTPGMAAPQITRSARRASICAAV